MKKILKLFFVICIIAGCLAGCSLEPAGLKDEIAPKILTQEQKDIVHLLSIDKQEILLFDYKTEEAYESVECWVEIYKKGVLIDRPSGVSLLNDTAKPLDGQLAIQINQNPNFQWAFSINEGGSRISHTSGPTDINIDTLGRSFGPIDEPIAIENGKEIVLYISIFANDGISIYGNKQIYIEQPELINEYPYVHIIKCRFDN